MTGQFITSGEHVVDPTDHKFYPVGVNGYGYDRVSIGGADTGFWASAYPNTPMNGHITGPNSAQAYGFNIVRVCSTDMLADPGAVAGHSVAQMSNGALTLADECIAAGIVAMGPASWEYTSNNKDPSSGTVLGSARLAMFDAWCDRYKPGGTYQGVNRYEANTVGTHAAGGSPYGWLDYLNEPWTWQNPAGWVAVGTALYNRARARGFTGIFVQEALSWAQDITSINSSDSAYAAAIPNFFAGKTNCVLGWHNYGGQSDAAFVTALQSLQNLGIPVVCGETGCPTDETLADWETRDSVPIGDMRRARAFMRANAFNYGAPGYNLWMGAAWDGYFSTPRTNGGTYWDTSRALTISGTDLLYLAAHNPSPLVVGPPPDPYDVAFARNEPFAVAGPYSITLSGPDEADFRNWVTVNDVAFDPDAATVDYDMRSFWQQMVTVGPAWVTGDPFPRTYTTPYSTTFSNESMYATIDNPFQWDGENLIDTRDGSLIFGPGGGGGGGGSGDSGGGGGGGTGLPPPPPLPAHHPLDGGTSTGTARAELFSREGAMLSPLSTLTALQWQEALNDPGSGSMTMPLDDPESLLVTAGCEVRCLLDDVVVFSWVVDKDPERRTIDQGEESGQTLTATGRGRAAKLADARVYPYKGLAETTMGQSRLYTFASPDFPNLDDWAPAVEVDPQTRPDIINPTPPPASFVDTHPYRYAIAEVRTSGAGDIGFDEEYDYVRTAAPRGWLDTTAYWIWGVPEGETMVPGLCYFRKQFTLADDTALTIAATADDHYTLYLDGTPIIGDMGEPGDTWQVHKRVELILTGAGATYTLAAIAENQSRPGLTLTENPAGFLCSVYTVDEEQKLRDVICHSDASWSCLSYPDYLPGWTPGQILIDVFIEAQARMTAGTNSLYGYTCGFTALEDSAGHTWDGDLDAGPYVAGFAIAVGATLLDVLAGLVERGWLDYHVRAVDKVLDAWNPGTGAEHTAAVLANTGTVATSNILSLQFSPQTAPTTRLLVKWSAGFFEVEDYPSLTVHGIREGYVVIDAMNRWEAMRQAMLILNDLKDPVTALVVEIDPHGAGDDPYADFVVGDWIHAPDVAGVSTEYRLHGITVSLEDSGQAAFTLELASRILTPEREQFKLYAALGRGVVGDTRIHSTEAQTFGLSGAAS